MRLFITGATGFIGSAVAKELLEAGHQVVGLARSDASARALQKAGALVHRGSIEDLDCLQRAASEVDGAIHTAFFHEFTHPSVATRLRVICGGSPSGIVSRFMAAANQIDQSAIRTIGKALRGGHRALVIAGATMSMRAGQLARESDAPDPESAGAPRIGGEKAALSLTQIGVRSSVIRLPPVVHGAHDRAGFLPRLIQIARKKGVSASIGNGQNRWPSVHVLDAAHLFRLALERGSAGSKYHAIAEEGVPFRVISEKIARRLDVPLASKNLIEGEKHFSWLARFLSVDNPVSSEATQEQLGWQPLHASLEEDIDKIYFNCGG